MDFPQRAVFFLEEDSSLPAHSKPLMLEAVLFCPILTWVGDKLRADGVERFFIVCGPTFAEEVRRCFPAEAGADAGGNPKSAAFPAFCRW